MYACAAFALLVGAAHAQAVPPRLTEQGRLFDAQGMPLAGKTKLVFSIYAEASGGSPLWTETYELELDQGYYAVQLGSKQEFPASLWGGPVRFIGIKVNVDEEMTPREEVASVPYALAAQNVFGNITPLSVSIAGSPVIDGSGRWVGPAIAGSQGAMGPKGDPGPEGPAGPPGPKGDKGDPGGASTVGPAGPAGPEGPKGDKGDPGGAGPKGDKGDSGGAGPKGDKGDPGAPGPKGDPGAPGLKGDTGAKGDPGAQGANGDPGAQGPPGITRLSVRRAESAAQTIAPNGGTVSYVTQACASDETLTGGGCNFGAGTSFGGLRLISSFPNPGNNGWNCYFENVSTGSPTAIAYAMCMKLGP